MRNMGSVFRPVLHKQARQLSHKFCEREETRMIDLHSEKGKDTMSYLQRKSSTPFNRHKFSIDPFHSVGHSQWLVRKRYLLFHILFHLLHTSCKIDTINSQRVRLINFQRLGINIIKERFVKKWIHGWNPYIHRWNKN